MKMLDFKQCCRLCLQSFTNDNVCNIFSTDIPIKEKSQQIFLPEIIENLTSLKMEENDEMPQNICNDCFRSLLFMNDFRQTILNADGVLKNEWHSNECKNEMDIELEQFEKTISKKKLSKSNKTVLKSERYINKCENEIDIQLEQLEKMIPKKKSSNSNKTVLKHEQHAKKCKNEIDNEFEQFEKFISKKKLSKANKTVLKNERHINKCENETDIELEPKSSKSNKIDCYKPKKCCDICGRLFFGIKHLLYHKNTHTGLRPYTCKFENCGKTYTSPIAMNDHYKRCHTDFFRYECKICGGKFNLQATFKDHMSYHEEPQLPCNFCGKLFRNRRILARHKMTHTGERPFPCDQCSKSFQNRYNLKVHKRVHTKEKPFVCCNCDESFGYNSLLKAHTQRHHPVD